MGDDYLRIREKENAKEWQMTEDAGVHKGNIYSYFNQYIDEDHSDSAAEEPAPSQSKPPIPSTRTHVPLRTPVPKVIPRRVPGAAAKKRPITLTTQRDNAAKVAWRNNQEPSRSYDVGVALRDIEPNVVKLQHTLEEIGVRLGSFILAQRSPNGSHLLIWGTPEQVQLTVDELGRWRVRAGAPSSKEAHRPERFATIRSTISTLYALNEKDAKRNAMRQRYQKKPENGRKFKYNGYFLWPNNEIRAIDLFGPNCEALDPLRMDNKAYVSFDEARSLFRVHTDSDEKPVTQVIRRIENTIKEYVARDHRPSLLFLVEPPMSDHYRSNVQTIPGPLLGLNRSRSRIPILCGDKLQPHSITDWDSDGEAWRSRNEGIMCTTVHKVLERIPYYRGHLRMRVNIGLFTLIKFPWPAGAPSVALEKFSADVQQTGTRGVIIRDLQLQREPVDILEACNHANELFEPIEPSMKSLTSVLPHYSAMFYLRHPEKPDEMIQLEVDLKGNEAESGSFEGAKAQWKKHGKPDVLAQAPPLEVFSIRLHNGISWQLKISAENTLDLSRITPQMQDFVNNVMFRKPPHTENPAQSGYKVFTTPANLRIVGMEQKTTFKYSLKAQPQFVFELSRYDEYNGDNPWLPSSTQWAAIFYDREWDEKLGENAKLGIGQAASWTPHGNPLFKPNNTSATGSSEEGFKGFLHHTKSVVDFLDELQAIPQEPLDASKDAGKSSYDPGPESEQSVGLPVVRLPPPQRK
ncbi:MAG: hypothetical protein Q9218_001774 [Villophora microphyllina]